MYVPPPELIVCQTAHWLVNQCVGAALPGYLIVSSCDPEAQRLAQLSLEGRRELGPLLARLEDALDTVLAPSHVYVSRWGHSPGHTVHFHVIPVSPWMVEAAMRNDRYRDLLRLHGKHENGPAGVFDGVDLTLYIVREFLESPTPPPVEGATVQQIVRRLKEHVARDTD